MKKVLSVNVGGICFYIETDAYNSLKKYLDEFESCLDKNEAKDIMEDIESRISEIFREDLKNQDCVVDEKLVNKAISILGKPEGNQNDNNILSKLKINVKNAYQEVFENRKRLYRDTDNVKLAGICSGISLYFGFDVAIVRILALLSLIISFGTTALAYAVMFFVIPQAITSAEKLELRGLPITPENIKKYPSTEKKRTNKN